MVKHGLGYAYELEDGVLCNWAEPRRESLEKNQQKPSPNAKIVSVMIIKRPSKKFRSILIEAIKKSQRVKS